MIYKIKNEDKIAFWGAFIIAVLIFTALFLALPSMSHASSFKTLKFISQDEVKCAGAVMQAGEHIGGCYDYDTNTIYLHKGESILVLYHEFGHFLTMSASMYELRTVFNRPSNSDFRATWEYVADRYMKYALGADIPKVEKDFFIKQTELANK